MKKTVDWLVKKTTKGGSLKRPVKRYVQFSLWFGLVAVGVLIVGATLFFSLLAIGLAVAGDAIWVFKSAFIIAATIISAGILMGSLYMIAELMKNKKHTLARWTRKSLRPLALLTVLPLILTVSVVLATGDSTNSRSKQDATGLPSWAQDAADVNTYWTPQGSIANGSEQQPSTKPNTSTTSSQSAADDAWWENHKRQMNEQQAWLAERDRCLNLENTANETYGDAFDRAQAAQNTVMAEWPAAQARMQQLNYPQYMITSEYYNFQKDAYTKRNAIIKPAYAEYVATLNSIRAQGCQVTQLHSDYSMPGY